MTGLRLRPYQEEALDAIEGAKSRSQLVTLPTGTGKTVVFSELIRRLGAPALILAHRDELLQQAADKLATVAPELAMTVGFVQATRNEVGAPIVLGSVQTLARSRRLEQLPREFRVVIIDEAHHATAASYRRILEHLDPELVVGVTATAERHDKKSHLRDVFDEIVYARSLEEMIREGYLCDLRGIRVELEALDLDSVKRSRGDFQADELGKALEAADAIEHSIGAYEEHAPGRKAIAFFPTVALASSAAAAFQEAGHPAAVVHGETPKDERREIIRSLAAGDLEVVTNVDVLTEGFDEPSLNCVIVAIPTRSRIRYTQMVGRGTRIHPGKSDCLILDLAGCSEQLSVQSIGSLFSLKQPPKKDETVIQAIEREARAAQSAADAAAQKKKRRSRSSRSVELFNRDRIHWTRIDDRWVLGLGKEFLVLDPPRRSPGDGSQSWRVLVLYENRARVAARNLDFGYAQGVAEEIVRDSGSISLVDTEARWRSDPASAGQLRMMRRLGIPATEGELTKGDAAERITEELARERLERFDAALEGARA